MPEAAVGVIEAPVVVRPPEPTVQPSVPEPTPIAEPVENVVSEAETKAEVASEDSKEDTTSPSESEEKTPVEDVKELDLTEIPEDLKERPRWTQAFVRKIEKFQDKHARLGLQTVAKIETKETRFARVRGTIHGLTNDEMYKEQLEEFKSTHKDLPPETQERLLKNALATGILKKAGRNDLKVIKTMLEDPDSYPEIKKIEKNLREMLPGEMKSRNTRKVKKGAGIMFFAMMAELFGESSGGYEQR